MRGFFPIRKSFPGPTSRGPRGKKRLISVYGATPWQVASLVEHFLLVYCVIAFPHLHRLVGSAVSDAIFRSFWMIRLPNYAHDNRLGRIKSRQNPWNGKTMPTADSRSRKTKRQPALPTNRGIGRECVNSVRKNTTQTDRPRTNSRSRNPEMCRYHKFASKAGKGTPPYSFATGNKNA